MADHRHARTRLIRRDGSNCHYCNCPLTRSKATADHVVPKAFGGRNHVDNYVLACQDCNGTRGTDLRWCDCDFCGPLISEYLDSAAYYDRIFNGIIYYNKPIIRFRTGLWKVYLYRDPSPEQIHTFRTWEDAMDFALTYGKEPRHELRNSDHRYQ